MAQRQIISGYLVHAQARCSGITVFFALTAFFHSLYAQEQNWPIDGPAFSTSPVEIRTAVTRIKPDPFTDVTVLFEQECYRLDSAGKVNLAQSRMKNLHAN